MILHHSKKYIFGIFALSLVVLTVVGFAVVYRYVQNISQHRLELAVQDLEDKIRSRIAIYDDMLYGFSALFATSQEVTRDEWRVYMQGTEIQKRYPGISVVGYAPVVRPEELAAFEQRVQQELPGYQVFPDNPTPVYAPVTYIDPISERTKYAWGFNMFSEPVRKAALEYARDHNSIAITTKVIPASQLQQPNPQPAFLMILPIYGPQADLSTLEQRRSSLKGYVIAVLWPQEFMSGVLVNTTPKLEFQIFDDSTNGEISERSLLFDSGTGATTQPGYVPEYAVVNEIAWPNTIWHVRYITDPSFGLTGFERILPYIVLIFSTLLTITLLVLERRILKSYQLVSNTAAEYKSDLIAEDAIVDAIEDAIIATNENGLITVFNKKAEQMLGFSDQEVVDEMAITELVSPDTLTAKIAEISQELETAAPSEFEALITQSLINGQDTQGWVILTSKGLSLSVTVVIKPLYLKNSELIGYQFKIVAAS